MILRAKGQFTDAVSWPFPVVGPAVHLVRACHFRHEAGTACQHSFHFQEHRLQHGIVQAEEDFVFHVHLFFICSHRCGGNMYGRRMRERTNHCCGFMQGPLQPGIRFRPHLIFFTRWDRKVSEYFYTCKYSNFSRNGQAICRVPERMSHDGTVTATSLARTRALHRNCTFCFHLSSAAVVS